jgi:FMN reductase
LGAGINSRGGIFRDGGCTDSVALAQLDLVGRQVVEFARFRNQDPSVMETGTV